MKRSAFYFPLVLAIVLTIGIGLIPIGPVFGDSLPVCQGTGSSSARVVLGGRVITPSTILRSASLYPCATNETTLNVLSLIRTQLVSPKATPIQGGDALLAAMTVISNSNPSATNPWLLKLEPGIYDLNGRSLTLLPYVDLEGSGEETTVISSAVGSNNLPSNGTVIMSSTTELRSIKVLNSGGADKNPAVFVPTGVTNARLTNSITLASSVNNNYGVYNFGTIIVQNSTLSASNGGTNVGLFNSYGTVAVQNSTLSASNGSFNIGFLNDAGIATVKNSTAKVSGGSSENRAIQNHNVTAKLIVNSSTLSASDGINSYGLYNDLGTVMVQNGTLSASGGTNNYGFMNYGDTAIATVNSSTLTASSGTNYGLYNAASGTVTVNSSTLSGSGGTTNYSLNNISGTVKVGASQLSGPMAGTITCVLSYDGNFSSICP